MRLHVVLSWLVISVAAAACSKSSSSGGVCDKYAELEVKCGGYEGDEAAGTRKMARSFCESARKDKDDNVLSTMIYLESECAAKETECTGYNACVEKAKNENDPPGM